ncbi:hypothetical protein GX586_12755 [bacterium]|nr:hypothetical protein [bacterium]
MNNRILRRFVASVLLVSIVMSAEAGWRYEVIDYFPNPPGTTRTTVTFYYWQSGYESMFTIYKPVSGMRFYMTVFNATYPEYKYYMLWNTAVPANYPITDPTQPFDPTMPRVGGQDMTEPALSAGGSVNFNIFMGDHFRWRYGKNCEVAFLVMAQPGHFVGPRPNVNITVYNAKTRVVNVQYPRSGFTLGSTTNGIFPTGRGGIVTVACGNNNALSQNNIYGPVEGIGGILISGGYLSGAGAGVTTRGRSGIPQITLRARRVRKFSLFQGGSAHGSVLTAGRIVNLFVANGLGTPAGSGQVPTGLTAPQYASGWFDGVGVGLPSPYDLGKVMIIRGGSGGTVAAGSDPTSAVGPVFAAAIKKIYIGNKLGVNTSLTNCTFISASRPRVFGPGVLPAAGGNNKVVTANGTFTIGVDIP